jgi:hypothetical protein
MATVRQKVLQAPLLLNIATWSDAQISVVKSDGELDFVTEELKRGYEDTIGQVSDLSGFHSDVKWCRKEFQVHGLVAGEKGRTWTVTDKGLKRLKQYVLCILSTFDTDERRRLSGVRSENGQEWLIENLRVSDDSQLRIALDESKSTDELFVHSMDIASPVALRPVIVSYYEELRRYFFTEHELLVPFAFQ